MLAALQDLAAGRGGTALYPQLVAGGKVASLQALCAAQSGAAYFPLGQSWHLSRPAVLEGMESLPLLAIDDLELVWPGGLGTGAVQSVQRAHAARSALRHRRNRSRQRLPLQLPDLRSRLGALAHFAVHPLDETQQREALRRRAQARGLVLPEETLTFLQRHFARDMVQLCALLDRLDAASLAQQRRLTVPFIREVLGETP